MSSLSDLTKEQLLEIITEFSKKMKGAEEKIEKLDAFYKLNLIDNERVPSVQSRINVNLELLKSEVEKLEELKLNIRNFSDDIFIDTNERKSIKTQINSHLSTSELDAKKIGELKSDIQSYSNETLIDVEGKESLRTTINKLYDSLKNKNSENFNAHKSLLIDEEGKKSIINEIESVRSKILLIHQELAIDEPSKESIKTNISKIHETYSKHLKDATISLESLKEFYQNVFESKVNDLGVEEEGLKKTTETLKLKLTNLIKETTEKLHALTDSSLHNSFYTRAKSHSEEYQTLQDYTFKSVISIAIVTVVFATIQLINILWINKTFSYQISYYQVGITLPLIYLVWMFNRNQKIAKKLAEEYHHKAALSEAMTGYRGLYQLKHDSPEYMNLFNSIKEQLNINPSTKIDKFLSLKSPQENLIDKGAELINTNTIGKNITETIK